MEDNIQELMELGERYFKKEDFSLARECFEKIISLNPDHLEAKNNLGVILFQLGQIDEAIDCFQDILKKDGNNEDALANLKMLQNFLQEKVGPIQNVKQRLKVGFVSIWFERGQSYVTKIIRDAVEKEHETFVFARTGGVYGEAKLETSGQWAVPNLTVWPDYAIPGDAIIRWIRENGLDIVIFNEEYDWNLVRTVKMCGVKVLTLRRGFMLHAKGLRAG
jgi:hypothetical protein